MIETASTICPVILAGGGGTRLWPLSREHYPKQFLSFNSEYSMLQQSLLRICSMESEYELQNPVLICNEEHRFLVAEHARQLNVTPNQILLEPTGRNTAPALTMAALRVRDLNPVLLMLPADHYIQDTEAFQVAVRRGMVEASAGKLVTFGIKPLSAETGYGYLNAVAVAGKEIYTVKRFVEKPDLQTAEHYVRDGNFFWNSGIFMMQASVWLDAINQYRPDIAQSCAEVNADSTADGEFVRLSKKFALCPSDSIDYAVMEKACSEDTRFQTSMIVLDAGWSDLGSWSAIWETSPKDSNANVISGDVLTEDTHNSIIQSHSRLVTAIGCESLLIIETPDAVLVGNRNQSQDVKKIVEVLKQSQRAERINHRRVFRPWGSYETVDAGERFQVKRLTVNIGKKLSLQLHHRRAEHWVVVRGVATVTRGNDTFDLKENESIYIPLGVKHRLENRQQALLELIEVQSGDYLGEDDIVRFEDDFGRHTP
jgi:mannose-1-phosphate guanylyltransferase/mannose-6-phosphate isomerase